MNYTLKNKLLELSELMAESCNLQSQIAFKIFSF